MKTLANLQKIKLSAVEGHLAEIKNLIGTLRPRHLAYFRMVKNVEELIKFLSQISDKKFDETTKFLDADLQGHEFGLRVINSLIGARRFLQPFLSRISWDGETRELDRKKGDEEEGAQTLIALSADVKKIVDASGKLLESKLDEISRLPQHMPDIRVWFSRTSGTLTLDSILQCVANHMKGYYMSRLAFHPSGEALILCEGDDSKTLGDGYMEYPTSYVQDLIRRVTIFVGQNVNKERLEELRDLTTFTRTLVKFISSDFSSNIRAM